MAIVVVGHPRAVSELQASRVVDAPPDQVFALLATPDRHPELDASGTVWGRGPISP